MSSEASEPKGIKRKTKIAMVIYVWGHWGMNILDLIIITEPSGVIAHLRVQWLISQHTIIELIQIILKYFEVLSSWSFRIPLQFLTF